MATYVIGIDPAARKLAMWSQTPGGGPPRHKFVTLSQQDEVAAHQAFRALCEEFGDLTELAREAGDDEPRFVVYQEAPIVYGSGSRIGPTISQALVAGGYMAAAGEYYAEHHRVHPSTWKARVVGHGSADKGKIQEYVAETWPKDYEHCFTNRGLVIEDLADARCIMQFGIMNNAMRQAMAKRLPKKKRAKR